VEEMGEGIFEGGFAGGNRVGMEGDGRHCECRGGLW
jgi:hypothetical protein